MQRVLKQYHGQLILPLENSGRLPLDIIMATPYKTRVEAVKNDALRFFNGQPCRRGHFSDRYASTGNCVECFSSRKQEVKSGGPVGVTIPPCVVGPVLTVLCVKCPRAQNLSCGGMLQRSQVVRATFAFPNHVPVRRVDALSQHALLFKSDKPCEACGVAGWRHVQTYACGVCEVRKKRKDPNWLPDPNSAY